MIDPARPESGAEMDDAALMERIAAGDAAAFAAMLDRYMNAVFCFSYALLKDAALAEDITQETCLRLWNNAGQWQRGGAVKSWLLRVAHNACIDEIRRRKPHVNLDAADHILPPSVDGKIAAIQGQAIADLVMKGLLAIPDRQKTALMLVYYSECTNGEAAQIMGVSVEALESLLARGRKALKGVLEPCKTDLLEG